MRDKVLLIIRGLPGSGKSTLASRICKSFTPSEEELNVVHCETDDYFRMGNWYAFEPSLVPQAHKWCYEKCKTHMGYGEAHTIIVSNTSTRQWEYEKYIALAREYGYKVQVIDVHGEFNNVHGVPPEAVERMDTRWEPFNRNLLKRDVK